MQKHSLFKRPFSTTFKAVLIAVDMTEALQIKCKTCFGGNDSIWFLKITHLEEARTRTGTRRRLQMRVRRPCTPIQGKSRQYLISMMKMVTMIIIVINVKRS